LSCQNNLAKLSIFISVYYDFWFLVLVVLAPVVRLLAPVVRLLAPDVRLLVPVVQLLAPPVVLLLAVVVWHFAPGTCPAPCADRDSCLAPRALCLTA